MLWAIAIYWFQGGLVIDIKTEYFFRAGMRKTTNGSIGMLVCTVLPYRGYFWLRTIVTVKKKPVTLSQQLGRAGPLPNDSKYLLLQVVRENVLPSAYELFICKWRMWILVLTCSKSWFYFPSTKNCIVCLEPKQVLISSLADVWNVHNSWVINNSAKF